MRVDVVKQPRILAIVTFVVVMAVIVVRLLHAPYPVEMSVRADMPLGKLIDGSIGRLTVGMMIIAIIMVFMAGVFMAWIVSRYNIGKARTFLPMVVYILMGYGLIAPFITTADGLTSLLLIVSAQQMIAGFKRSYTFNNVFYSAFCLGLMPLTYSTSLPLVIILPITLALYRRTAREWIVAIVGLGLPLLIASAAWWASGYGWGFILASLGKAFTTSAGAGIVSVLSGIGVGAYVYMALSAGILLLSIVSVVAGSHKMGVRTRKIYVHFICIALLSALTFFIPSGTIVSIGIIAVPAALLSMAFFIRFRGWLSLSVYLAMLVTVVAINLMPVL